MIADNSWDFCPKSSAASFPMLPQPVAFVTAHSQRHPATPGGTQGDVVAAGARRVPASTVANVQTVTPRDERCNTSPEQSPHVDPSPERPGDFHLKTVRCEDQGNTDHG